MNVLIITPDAVGSTLLQRLLTINMQLHGFDRPVINLHELTNGISKYYNEYFKQDVVGKQGHTWGYHQSLQEVVELLDSADHYKTSRLAQYHIKARQDSLADQISFYEYLNKNFYVISCRRHNVFEHALSRCLAKVTKKLNVYDTHEKLETFFDIYKQGINIDPHSLLQTLNDYSDYIRWSQDHFEVASYFLYEEHLPHIENYILNLPFFKQDSRITWKDRFGIDFNTWNRYRYVSGNLGSLCLDRPELLAGLSYQGKNGLAYQGNTIPLPNHGQANSNSAVVTLEFKDLLPANEQEFLRRHEKDYNKTCQMLDIMVADGIMISQPPMKKQTLAEKKYLIKNYDNLLGVYNHWILDHPGVGVPITHGLLDSFAEREQRIWQDLDDPESTSQQPLTLR